MEFSINVYEVINMSLDTVNGNLNFHFLKRLLEAFVNHSGLNKYDMIFTGQDALRAQQVWSGCPDPNENPLDSEFSIKPNKDINQHDEESVNDRVQGSDSIGEMFKSKNPNTNTILQTEVDGIEYGGTLNLNVLKQIEKLMNKNYLDSDNNKTRQTDYEENESRKTFELVVMKEMELLTSRVNKFENIARVLQPINSGVDLSNSSNFDSERSERSRSQKKVHVKPSPSNIFGPKELPINEIIGSKIRENINVGSAKSITLLDGTTCDQSSPSINSTEIENNDTLSSYIINRQASYSTTEKYILTNQQPNALLKHIEKILGRMNKVEHEIQMLMEKENNLSESKSIYSETSSDDVNLEPDISHYVRFNLHESVMQEVKLKTLGKKDVFQRLFRVTQKKKDLDSYLTVRNFRSFLEDYTEKFGIIHEFLMFHNERIMTKVDSKDYESFKNTVRITHHEIKNDIKEYTLRDPEAAGIVHFVKGVTCISCEKPVMMKTTNVPFKHPTKGVFLPRPSLKAHLTYELDRVRKQYNRTPGTRDMNLSLKCKEPATRICANKKTV